MYKHVFIIRTILSPVKQYHTIVSIFLIYESKQKILICANFIHEFKFIGIVVAQF